jgi:2-phospho-L-lactate/phosphoenolpyruvate guanylyltransferase
MLGRVAVRTMRAVLIPVKDLNLAKQRLAPHLSQTDRTALAEAMFEDVGRAVAGVRAADRIYLVSSWGPALDRARSLGWEIIPEREQQSESASVDFAARQCAKHGVTCLLRLPIDIPLVEASDIDEVLLSILGTPSTVLVPSRSGNGTNALLRSPPNLFASHFGPDSFRQHVEEARRSRARCRVLRNSHIELDIDEFSDVQAFMSVAKNITATVSVLQHLGFHATCLDK